MNDDLEQPDGRMIAYTRHLLGLTWIDVATDPNSDIGPRYHIVSGFIISVDDQWVWITAGHILADIQKMLTQGRKIHRSRFVDFAKRVQTDPGIPFPYDMSNLPYLYNDDEGYDYGMVLLGAQPRALLQAVGKQAMGESRWETIPEKVLGYEMIGVPKELTTTDIKTDSNRHNVTAKATLYLAPIEHVPNPPEDTEKPALRFYGKLRPQGDSPFAPPMDIDGMSGSPIFGVGVDAAGQANYWPIAIQSGWFSERRIIFGSPLKMLGVWIRQKLKEISEMQDEAGEQG